jgi:hypothetical protein
MAYQTGAAASQADLVQQLAAWLVTQGWTLDTSAADGTGWRCHLHKGGWYVHLKVLPTGDAWNGIYANHCTVPALYVYMSTAYAGAGAAWYASTTGAPLGTDGKVCGTGLQMVVGAQTAYHFFHDGSDHYVVVLERTPGLFNQLGFGLSVTKHGGAWTGGPYIHGQMTGDDSLIAPLVNDNAYCPFGYDTHDYMTCNGSFLRADADGFLNNWISIGSDAANARRGWTGKQGYSTAKGQTAPPATIPHTQNIFDYSVSSINAQAVLLPIRIYVALAAGGAALLATAPSVYQCNAVGYGFSAGAAIVLGADTYMVFPTFAVKKVV